MKSITVKDKEYLSLRRLAKDLDKTRQTIYLYVAKGMPVCYVSGDTMYFDIDIVRDWISKNIKRGRPRKRFAHLNRNYQLRTARHRLGKDRGDLWLKLNKKKPGRSKRR
ncbi:MAG: hypothetical protein WCY49_06235 [Anaerovoracaceae bacterium]|jgi:hypothetical protein